MAQVEQTTRTYLLSITVDNIETDRVALKQSDVDTFVDTLKKGIEVHINSVADGTCRFINYRLKCGSNSMYLRTVNTYIVDKGLSIKHNYAILDHIRTLVVNDDPLDVTTKDKTCLVYIITYMGSKHKKLCMHHEDNFISSYLSRIRPIEYICNSMTEVFFSGPDVYTGDDRIVSVKGEFNGEVLNHRELEFTVPMDIQQLYQAYTSVCDAFLPLEDTLSTFVATLPDIQLKNRINGHTTTHKIEINDFTGMQYRTIPEYINQVIVDLEKAWKESTDKKGIVLTINTNFNHNIGENASTKSQQTVYKELVQFMWTSLTEHYVEACSRNTDFVTKFLQDEFVPLIKT